MTSIFCVNAGSSSLKLAVYPIGGSIALATGAVEGIGQPGSRFWLRDADDASLVDEARHVGDHGEAVDLALSVFDRIACPPVAAVGHRLVHGGRRLVEPTLLDDSVVDELRRLVPLAPLHLAPQIAAVEAVASRAPSLPQVACFDTAFHRRMPEVAQRFPLPEWAWEEGICRFGFHGLSYEHVARVLGPACGRVVVAHLGNGASMAAIHDGRPTETTMALTPTAGLMMGTRSGDLDPGLIVHLLRERRLSPDAIDHLVNHESGLLGVSGTTSDMRTLLESRASDARAALAIAMFCHSARKSVGALAAALGGIDQLVFTGGVGEHAPAIRTEICGGLGHLGVRLDEARNAGDDPVVSADGASCVVRIVPAREELVIARHTARTALSSQPA